VGLFEGHEVRVEYEAAYENDGIRYKDLKEELAEAIYEVLAPIQEKRRELDENTVYVDEVIGRGVEKAREVARGTVTEVREVMGLPGRE